MPIIILFKNKYESYENIPIIYPTSIISFPIRVDSIITKLPNYGSLKNLNVNDTIHVENYENRIFYIANDEFIGIDSFRYEYIDSENNTSRKKKKK